jgi:hypothetical protein
MGTKHLELIIHESKKQRFLELLTEIDQYIKEGNAIPIGNVKYLLSLLLTKNNFNLRSISEKCLKSAEVTDKFLERNRFGKTMKVQLEDDGQVHEFKNPFPINSETKGLYFDYYITESVRGFKSLNEVIRFFYKKLRDEIRPKFNQKDRNSFSKYHMSIISRILALGVGFSWPKKKEPTMQELFQSTRSALKNEL